MRKTPELKTLRTEKKSEDFLGNPSEAGAVLERVIWPDGTACPDCEGGGSPYLMAGARSENRRTWACKDCAKQFTIRHGTWLYRGRIALDKVLFGLLVLRDEGEDEAIRRLVLSARLKPETAEGLVEDLRVNCLGGPGVSGEAARVAPWRIWAVAAGVLVLSAVGPVWRSGVVHGAGGTEEALVSAPMQEVLQDVLPFEVRGKSVSATVITLRGGFESSTEWHEAHREKVARTIARYTAK